MLNVGASAVANRQMKFVADAFEANRVSCRVRRDFDVHVLVFSLVVCCENIK